MGILEFITSLVAMVLTAITVWILLLRKSRRRAPIQAEGHYELNELAGMAASLKDRIDTLESILDAEVPDWREQNEHGSE